MLEVLPPPSSRGTAKPSRVIQLCLSVALLALQNSLDSLRGLGWGRIQLRRPLPPPTKRTQSFNSSIPLPLLQQPRVSLCETGFGIVVVLGTILPNIEGEALESTMRCSEQSFGLFCSQKQSAENDFTSISALLLATKEPASRVI